MIIQNWMKKTTKTAHSVQVRQSTFSPLKKHVFINGNCWGEIMQWGAGWVVVHKKYQISLPFGTETEAAYYLYDLLADAPCLEEHLKGLTFDGELPEVFKGLTPVGAPFMVDAGKHIYIKGTDLEQPHFKN